MSINHSLGLVIVTGIMPPAADNNLYVKLTNLTYRFQITSQWTSETETSFIINAQHSKKISRLLIAYIYTGESEVQQSAGCGCG